MNVKIDDSKSRSELIEIARLCYEKGYICGLEGNFSVRLADDLVLTTPRGSCKGRLNESDLVLTDMSGEPVSGGQPSTELKMHLMVYRHRPDIKAVVHAHPVTALGLTVAGVSLAAPILPEIICSIGNIPTAPYATPSTDEIPNSIVPFLKDHDAMMLDHHGALVYGSDLYDAFYKLETVEHFAQTLVVAYQVGRPIELTSAQVSRLHEIKSIYQTVPSVTN
ncbi:MAG: class II aldolase/adducin family protein [Candidatus Obscuribacterales bacterium]|nr:class II aldolase/adducin family protein [Candidatus Obscuribacterales bacterium]